MVYCSIEQRGITRDKGAFVTTHHTLVYLLARGNHMQEAELNLPGFQLGFSDAANKGRH